MNRKLAAAGVCAAAIFANPQPAQVHPHVFAEARLDVVIDGSQVTTLRHLWRFDEVFTSTVIVEFDADTDLELDPAELEAIAAVVHESLAEFDYFQIITSQGKDVAMQPPEKLIADIQDNQLIILFESLPSTPLELSGLTTFGIYDPTFYTAIEYVDDSHLSIANLPSACAKTVVRPDPDEAIAQNQQTLTEAFYDPDDTNDLSKIFATRLEIKCSGK